MRDDMPVLVAGGTGAFGRQLMSDLLGGTGASGVAPDPDRWAVDPAAATSVPFAGKDSAARSGLAASRASPAVVHPRVRPGQAWCCRDGERTAMDLGGKVVIVAGPDHGLGRA
jgi:hypothetical protein